MTRIIAVVRALFSRQWWWVTLIVIALMILLARLGFWQLDRLAQRRAANAQLLAAIESTPINLNDEFRDFLSISPGQVPTDLPNHNIVATGNYDYANQYVLKLQSWAGRAGVHLITPLILDGGDGVAVLVNRGWIPDAEYAAGNMHDATTRQVSIEGYIALTETISRRTADAVVPTNSNNELFRVDIAALSDELPYPILPFYVVLSPEGGSIEELPIPIPKEIDLSEGPHLDYAMQWFIFSAILGGGYLLYVSRWFRKTDAEAGKSEKRHE